MMRIMLAIYALVLLSACAVVMPYEENYACKPQVENLGVCGSLHDVYRHSLEVQP